MRCLLSDSKQHSKNLVFIYIIYRFFSIISLDKTSRYCDQYHQEEWYVYHSDLSLYVSVTVLYIPFLIKWHKYMMFLFWYIRIWSYSMAVLRQSRHMYIIEKLKPDRRVKCSGHWQYMYDRVVLSSCLLLVDYWILGWNKSPHNIVFKQINWTFWRHIHHIRTPPIIPTLKKAVYEYNRISTCKVSCCCNVGNIPKEEEGCSLGNSHYWSIFFLPPQMDK